MNASRLTLLALCAALYNNGASAALVIDYSNKFDIEFYDNRFDVFLNSEVHLESGIGKLRYELKYQILDLALDVIWRGNKGQVLLHGGNGFFHDNKSQSWDLEWFGMLAPNVTYKFLGGEADFSNGTVQVHPCLALVCPTSYYDWPHNEAPEFGARGDVQALPGGFENVTQTRSTVSNTRPSPGDPDVDVEITAYRFSSSYEAKDGGYVYRYTVDNFEDHSIAFEVPLLSLQGLLDPHASVVFEVLSLNAPGFLQTESTIRLDGGAFISGRFDALAPSVSIPEPQPLALLGAGLAVLWLVRRAKGPAGMARAA